MPVGELSASARTSASQAAGGKRPVAFEVLHQQVAIDADIEVIDASAETGLADEPCAGVLGGFFQIVDRGIVVVLDIDGVGGEGVRHLHRRLAVEIGIVREHAPEHRDVDRAVRLAQERLRKFLLLRHRLASGDLVGEVERESLLVRRDEGELADANRLWSALGLPFLVRLPFLKLAERFGDAASDGARLLFDNSFLDEVGENDLPQPLRTLALVADERCRRTPRTPAPRA